MPLYLQFPSWISPEIIPGLPFRWYGLMYLVAFGITYLLFMRQIKQQKLDISSDDVLNFFFWGILGLLVGARLFSVIFYDPTGQFAREPWRIIWPFDNGQFVGLQGMSYHGGFVGLLTGFAIYAKIKKIDLLQWGDMIANGAPLGYTFGRLGNFINGELYGRVSPAPWSMVFPSARPLPTNLDWVQETAQQAGMQIPDSALLINLPRHPSQLYEAFLEGILLWAILWFLVRPRKTFRGFSIGIYIIGYGLARFIVEYFREPDAGLGFIISLGGQNNPPQLFTSLLDISMGQILSLVMALSGVALLVVLKLIHNRRPTVQGFTDHTESKSNKD